MIKAKDEEKPTMNDTNKKFHQLAPDLTICRIINGMWQVAGGHGYIDHELAITDMMNYHDVGLTTWDLADIYGPAEDEMHTYSCRNNGSIR